MWLLSYLFYLSCKASIRYETFRKERVTEMNVIKANGAMFFSMKNERGRLLGILCLTCIIFTLIFILLYR